MHSSINFEKFTNILIIRVKLYFELLIFVLIISAATHTSAADHETLYDPIFGISFDPARVNFDRAPVSLETVCKDLPDTDLRVFGKLKTSNFTYYIMSGYRKTDTNGKPISKKHREPDPIGFIVAIAGSECILGDVQTVLNGKQGKSKKHKKHIKLSKEEISELSKDVAGRYVKAYGTKSALQKAINLSDEDKASLPSALIELMH